MPRQSPSLLARYVLSLLATLVLLPMSTAPAIAQEVTDVADEAEAQFLLGNAAYRKSDFLTALSHYFASNRLAHNRNVLFNIAKCYEQLARYVEAYRYYQQYGDGETDPKVREAINAALERIRPNVALLEVRTEPPGATLYLNRKDLGGYGSTPRELAVAPGQYTVILERPGYESESRQEVTLKVGERTVQEVPLTRILGQLQIIGEPMGAQVRVADPNGAVVGVVGTPMDVSPGTHQVEVSQDGYVPSELQVTVEAQSSTRVEVKLQRQTGTVVVQSDEPDALIVVDGRPVGFTPSVIDNLPAGTHEVVVQLSGFRPFTQTVVLSPDARELVDARLLVSEEVEAASRRVESLTNAPASVSLISRREIAAFAYVNADDALHGVRGYYSTDDATYVSPGLRGYSPFGQYGNRMLVLLDGHALNDDWIGSSYIGFDLMSDLYGLDQIEIVRGPVSVNYGTGAFFGVLNLVTPSQAPTEGRVEVGVSSVADGAVRARAATVARLGESGAVWLSGGSVVGQGRQFFSPANVGSRQEPDGTVDDAGGLESGMMMGKLVWGDLQVHGYFNQRDKQIPTGAYETTFGDDRTTTFDRRAFGEVKLGHRFSPGFALSGRAYYDHYAYEGRFAYDDPETGLTQETYAGHWAGMDLNTTLSPVDGMTLTLGTDVQRHFINRSEGFYGDAARTRYLDENHPYTQLSAYTQLSQDFGTKFTVSAAARFDGWWTENLPTATGGVEDRFINSTNPRLALIFKPTELDTIKLMGGRAFRAPSVYELTYNDGGLTQVPSPTLNSESILTGELEYSRRFLESYVATGAAYVNRLTDLIEQVGEGDEATPLSFVNRSEGLWTLGGELEVRREFRRGWMLAAQYSYQRTRLDDPFGGDRIANSPEHLASARGVFPLFTRQLRLATRLTFDGGRLDRLAEMTERAVVWDLTLSGEAPVLGLEYAAGVRNLLDWRYAYPVGEDVQDVTLRQSGRFFVVDVSLAF